MEKKKSKSQEKPNLRDSNPDAYADTLKRWAKTNLINRDPPLICVVCEEEFDDLNMTLRAKRCRSCGRDRAVVKKSEFLNSFVISFRQACLETDKFAYTAGNYWRSRFYHKGVGARHERLTFFYDSLQKAGVIEVADGKWIQCSNRHPGASGDPQDVRERIRAGVPQAGAADR